MKIYFPGKLFRKYAEIKNIRTGSMLWTADRGGDTGLLSFLVSLSALRHPEGTGKGPQRFVTLQAAVCYIIQRRHDRPVEIKKERDQVGRRRNPEAA